MSAIGENERIDELDYLRGFALLGIILVNIGPLLSVKTPAADSTDAFYWRFLYLFIEGRFYTIFTFLFGVGIYLFLSRVKARGKSGRVLFVRRMTVLFIFGLVHVQFHPGEALSIYAIAGLILLPFYKVNRYINLLFGLVMLVVIGLMAVKIIMVIPLILLGIAAGQFQVFDKIKQHLKAMVVYTGMLFFLGMAGLIFQFQSAPPLIGNTAITANAGQTQHFMNIGIMIGPVVSAFYAGGIVLLLQVPVFRKLLSPLKSCGRMAFTNYILQTTLILLVGKAWQLQSQINYLQTLYVCLAIYVFQFVFSIIWLRYFKFGPLEWIWRALTYWQLPPMRRKR